MTQEQITELITVIGEEPIERAFQLMGNEKVSFARLRLCVRKGHIVKALHEGQSFSCIAQRFEISRMTVYRIFYQECRLRKRRLA